jgi:hypothetical protein
MYRYIYLYNNNLITNTVKTPNPEKSEVFVMRISKEMKVKLEELAKAPKFNNNSSEVVRSLIESAHAKK